MVDASTEDRERATIAQESGIDQPMESAMKQAVSTITSEGQVTIPTEIREHLGVDAADDVVFVIGEKGKVELRPVRPSLAQVRGVVPTLQALEAVFGSVPALPGRETTDFEDQIRDAMEEEAERIVANMRGR